MEKGRVEGSFAAATKGGWGKKKKRKRAHTDGFLLTSQREYTSASGRS